MESALELEARLWDEELFNQRFKVGETRVNNEYGIHGRPSAMIVKEINNLYNDCEIFLSKADIPIDKKDNWFNAKKVMAMMMMEASHGTNLKVYVAREPHNEARVTEVCQKMAEYLSQNFEILIYPHGR